MDFDRYTSGSSSSRVYIDSEGKIGVNEWKHVAVTINVTSGEAKIFIDGNLDKTQSFTVGSKGLYNGDCCTFFIGTNIYDTYGDNFDGLIDEVRLTKKVLSPSDFILGSGSTANITFSALASDSDGSIANYTWISDVDGIIGYDSYLSLNVSVTFIKLSARKKKSSESKPFLLLKCLKIKPSDTSAASAIDLVDVALKPLLEKSSSDFSKISIA